MLPKCYVVIEGKSSSGLVLAQGLHPAWEDQGLRAECVACHPPDSDLQLRPGEVAARSARDPSAVI
jgi:predicted CxxxxCH...CXXCH cytochrome family protein